MGKTVRALPWRKSIAILVFVALLPVTPLTSQAAVAARRRLPRLAGITTVVGSESAWMKVRLPKDVDPFAQAKNPSKQVPFDLSGNGRLVGFVLTALPIENPRDQPSLFGWSLGRCMRRGCKARGFLTSWVFSWGTVERDGKQVLPAGRYRLYVIADGAPARIQIPFPGLKGTKTLRPKRPAEIDLQTLEPLSEKDDSGTMYWGGRSSDLEGPGFALAELWMDGEEVDGQAGSCIYEDREPPPDDVAYMPPCPAANVHDVNVVNADNNEVGYVGPGTLPNGMGLWRSAEKVDRAGGITLWLKY